MEALKNLVEQIVAHDGEISELPSDGKELCLMNCNSYNKLEGSLHLQDGYDCPKCRNKGFIAEPRLDNYGYWRDVSVDCECRKIRRSIRRLNRSGIGGHSVGDRPEIFYVKYLFFHFNILRFAFLIHLHFNTYSERCQQKAQILKAIFPACSAYSSFPL